MTPNEVTAAKGKIDADLSGKSESVGVAFGEDSFKAFVAAGLIQKRKFGVLGTTLLADLLPAYGDTHFAYLDWELPAKSVKVGG